MSETTESVIEEITQNYLAQCQAMVDADVADLGDLLAPDFTLTHMTGYVQNRDEWLDDIAGDRMIYHSIGNVDIVPDTGTDRTILTGRSHTHATIWGAEGTWRLQLRVEFTRTPGGWLAQRTVASTW